MKRIRTEEEYEHESLRNEVNGLREQVTDLRALIEELLEDLR